MKTALVGSSGYIAEFILKRFQEEPKIESVFRIDRMPEADACLDLSEAEKFDYGLLDDVDYIIFTAAISGPDQCAEEFEACWKVNVTGTKYFIHEAVKRSCRVLFFSSDAVFGDGPGTIYDEESETKARTPYGRMKKAVEDEFKDIFHPFYRNVTVVSDVVDVVVYFAFHWNEYGHTFLNVAGKELVSRVRMADELNRFLGGRLKYDISMPGEGFFANRPKITQMRSLYMQEHGILPDSTFTEKIAKELEEIEL